MSNEERPMPRCFLAISYSPEYMQVRDAIKKSAQKANFQVISLDNLLFSGTIQEAVIGELARADCVIADVSGRNPNVFFEIGMAQAMGKPLFLLAQQDSINEIPFDMRGYRYFLYDTTPLGLSALTNNLSKALREHKRSPRTRTFAGAGLNTPFFVDWDRLDRSDAENLCRELLAQMGFQKIDWSKEVREVDLIAELPKKDPDGFEYRELWLISTGRNASPDKLVMMASMEPEYFVYSFLRDSHRRERLMTQSAGELAVTLLVILLTGDVSAEEIEKMQERSLRRSRTGVLRIRIWDRNYLTSLVQQFPQIGYKYFSEEARFRSEHRKTAEELYKENLTLTDSLASTVTALEDEKNKRVRAERDAVWKDISFSAAHKIGNPLFAIETFLDPLGKRVVEKRTEEAVKVIGDIRETIETAKGIVEQFKSLARAQKIEPTKTLLRPILEKACQMSEEKEVDCDVKCPPKLTVQADPVRLAECFAELFSNATHWFDKTPKKIEVEVSQPAPQPLPPSVDSSQQYTLIRFKDNGSGVALEDKNKIFDAFFTKREHGTGLGLALVRRVIEGHGGFIFEDGIPGQGADFKIYLPIHKGEKAASASTKSRKQRNRSKAKNVTGTNRR
jgi:signal transduction histidine kinase